MKNSPILIMSFNRLQGLQKLVKSLLSNEGSLNSELWIAIDYCNDDVTDAIEAYSKTVTGFLKVHILRRVRNLGMTENWWQSVNEILRDNDYVIVLEDDHVVSSNFLSYMNFFLKKYSHDEKIFNVCAYSGVPINLLDDKNFAYFSQHYRSWGNGFFKRSIVHPNSIYVEARNYYLSFINWRKTNLISKKIFPLICQGYISNKVYGDVLFSHYVAKNNLNVIRPNLNLIINEGFDAYAAHCRVEDAVSMTMSSIDFSFIEPVPEPLNNQKIDLNSFFYYVLFIVYRIFGRYVANNCHIFIKKLYKFLRKKNL